MNKRITLLAILVAAVSVGSAHAAMVSGQGDWETTLLGRDINGKAVAATDASAVFLFDKSLNVTWLADAGKSGMVTWAAANNWANTLVVGGYSGWRLPTMVDTGLPGCDWANSGTDCGYNVQTRSGGTTYSEMANLYYSTLGNKSFYAPNGSAPQKGWGLTNTGPFQNMLPNAYWSGLALGSGSPTAWYFNNFLGSQELTGSGVGFYYATAVRPGDVAANAPAVVPLPPALPLLLMGFAPIAWAGLRRHR
jgi:hypothetical protein